VASGAGPHVAICVATFRRPGYLDALLASLAAQSAGRTGIAAVVVVVDNDADASARDVVERWRDSMPWTLTYAIEPARGISPARNTAMRLAFAAGAQAVAWIDDDETAAPDWLEQLLATQERYGADVVAGTVVPRFEPGVPEWARRGRFFERPVCATGAVLPVASTNNCLVQTEPVRRLGVEFDSRFALSGGEDTHFFAQLREGGARIVAGAEAVVIEHVPASRGTVRWLSRRAFQTSNGHARSERALATSKRAVVARGLKGVARIVQGLGMMLVSVGQGKEARTRALQRVCAGMGALAGALGWFRDAYLASDGA
jgi:GT2 family glycosyltransferase